MLEIENPRRKLHWNELEHDCGVHRLPGDLQLVVSVEFAERLGNCHIRGLEAAPVWSHLGQRHSHLDQQQHLVGVGGDARGRGGLERVHLQMWHA